MSVRTVGRAECRHVFRTTATRSLVAVAHLHRLGGYGRSSPYKARLGGGAFAQGSGASVRAWRSGMARGPRDSHVGPVLTG